MIKNDEAKYCPIILMNQGYHREVEQFCVRQACAWWVEKYQCCSVRMLAGAPEAPKATPKKVKK